jgi:predicted acetyltransferase
MGHIDIRVATDDDFPTMLRFDGIAFGDPWPDEMSELARATLDLDRFRVACDGDALVGIAGSYEQEVTVPGGAQVRAGGITWVAVAPTHRRQGILTRLMAELHDDIDARREPIAMLTASEGGIYERFGYGIASYLRVIDIDRRRTQVRPEFRPTPGSVRLTTLDDPALPEIFDRYRKTRVGEIGRTSTSDALAKAHHGAGVSVALHADGFASWKVKPDWNAGHPAHELTLIDMVAITPEAHAALWHTVLSVDLVGPVHSFRAVSLDDALPYIVDDQRAVRTTNVNDMLWLHLRDIGAALRARTYGTDDELVVEVDLDDRTERWRIAGSPEGAEVGKVRSRPHLRMNRGALGAIYLGGVRPSTLARAGRLSADDPTILRRADTFFMADRLPHCVTGF